jgi:hypothetical protein
MPRLWLTPFTLKALGYGRARLKRLVCGNRSWVCPRSRQLWMRIEELVLEASKLSTGQNVLDGANQQLERRFLAAGIASSYFFFRWYQIR